MIFIKFYILRPCKILFNCTLFHEYCTTEIMPYRAISTFILERNSMCGGPFFPSFCVIKQQKSTFKTWKSRDNTRSVPLLQGLESNFFVERTMGNTTLSVHAKICTGVVSGYSLFYRTFRTAVLQRTPVSVRRQLIVTEPKSCYGCRSKCQAFAAVGLHHVNWRLASDTCASSPASGGGKKKCWSMSTWIQVFW